LFEKNLSSVFEKFDNDINKKNIVIIDIIIILNFEKYNTST